MIQAWVSAETKSESLVVQAEQTFDCCGLGINRTTDKVYTKPSKEDHDWTFDHEVFKDRPEARCYTEAKNSTMSDKCPTCYSIITDKVRNFNIVMLFSSALPQLTQCNQGN